MSQPVLEIKVIPKKHRGFSLLIEVEDNITYLPHCEDLTELTNEIQAAILRTQQERRLQLC